MIRLFPLLLLSCVDPGTPADRKARSLAEVQLPEPTLRRLTQAQYQNTLGDLLSPSLVFPGSLEPDDPVDGLVAIGSGVTAVSPYGVEQYEDGAYLLAEQAMADASVRNRIVPCAPTGQVDDVCARRFAQDFGRRAWRRPLTEDELAPLVDVAADGAIALGNFHEGLVFVLGALLQSPHFVYRVELGEPDPEDPSQRRFTDHEMATRLSYFLWNTTPDDALLEAADSGRLTTDAGLRHQVERMVADPRYRQGVRAFFDQMLGLADLEDMTKDPERFVAYSDDVSELAREETLRLIEAHVVDDDLDYRLLMTTQRTFVDRKLASLYGVPAPSADGFGEVWLPEDGGRRGLLGHISILALHAHPVSSSATKRGAFVRENLLCQTIPLPPSDVDTSIPEPSADAPTLRDRVAVHLEDPTCAACHNLMDPLGLGLENFDGLGQWRTTEGGSTIDPSGELDGGRFADAWGLGAVMRDHPRLGPCLTETLTAYASGHSLVSGEDAAIEQLLQDFEMSGGSVQTLMVQLAMHPVFRQAGEVQP